MEFESNLRRDRVGVWEWIDEEEEMMDQDENDWTPNKNSHIINLLNQINPLYFAFGLMYFSASSFWE